VYRLAQISLNIIDQCVAQGVPFAREYGGLLDTRSFGGVQVQRTFYARGQTGQQLLLGAVRREKGRPDPVGGRYPTRESVAPPGKQSEREGLVTVQHEASDAKGPARTDQRALRHNEN